MPYTSEEIIGLVNGLLTDRIAPDALTDLTWIDGTPATPADIRDVLALYTYARRERKRKHCVGQRKAMRLLRSFLSTEQQRQLRCSDYFYAASTNGAVFRFLPKRGFTERVERHGSRYYSQSHFCLHDAEDDDQMPPADVTLAHLLLIRADEPRFLEMANEHYPLRQLWDREYLRRLRERRPA